MYQDGAVDANDIHIRETSNTVLERGLRNSCDLVDHELTGGSQPILFRRLHG
jgi:hypothetical protein